MIPLIITNYLIPKHSIFFVDVKKNKVVGEITGVKLDSRHGSKTFYKLLEEAAQIHESKSHDYASNDNPSGNYHFAGLLANLFAHSSKDAGFAGRIGEKIYRLANLESSGKVAKNEPIEDNENDLVVLMGLWMSDRRDRRYNDNPSDYGSIKEPIGKLYTESDNKKEEPSVMESSSNVSQKLDNIGIEIIKLTNLLPLSRLEPLSVYLNSVCQKRAELR